MADYYVDKFHFTNDSGEVGADNYFVRDADAQNSIDVLNQFKTSQESLNATQNEINNELENRIVSPRCVLFGDSYMIGYNSAGTVTGFGTILENMDENIECYGVSGAGFATTLENTFSSMVENQTISNPELVDRVIFVGGFNDGVNSGVANNIYSGMVNAVNACKSKMPNAKIYCMFIGNTKASGYFSGLRTGLDCWQKSGAYGISYIPGGENILTKRNEFYNSTDPIHPNSTGQQVLADFVYSGIFSGSVNPFWTVLNTKSGVNFATLESISGGTVTVAVSGTLSQSYTAGLDTVLDFGALSPAIFRGFESNTILKTTAVLKCNTALGYMFMPGVVTAVQTDANNYHLYVSPARTNPDQGALTITSTEILSCSFSCSSMY